MLCEMRGCDGNMSGWNGSHGSADSSRGSCMYRKMEIGAYVVNSNQASGHSIYYQGENDPEVVLSRYESSHQGFPDSRRNELRASNTYISEHPKRQAEQPPLRERRQLDFGSRSNQRMTMTEKHSGGHPQRPSASDNCRTSMHEMDTNWSTDGSVAGNIYQGPIVRVQVPEVYYEGRPARGSEIAVAHRQNVSSYNVDGEQMGQHLQRVRDTDEVDGGPVSVETYRRINEWLNNCQQHSSSTSSKSSNVSCGPNHSRTENKLKPNSTSGNISKDEHKTHNQVANISNLKPPNELRVGAALEPKSIPTVTVKLQPNHQQRHRNNDWNEKLEVPFRQTSAPRNNNVPSALSSNVNHVAKTTKPYFGSNLSTTSSEWSSETLSIVGSDKSSYCTDFTPFELGYADAASGIHEKDSVATPVSERPLDVGINVSISHVIIDDRMQMKNLAYPKDDDRMRMKSVAYPKDDDRMQIKGIAYPKDNDRMQIKGIAYPKDFSDTLHDSFGNEFVCNRRNDYSGPNTARNANFEPNFKHKLTDKIPKNLKDFEVPLQTPKTVHVGTVFIRDTQRTPRCNTDFDITKQNHSRYKKPTTDPVISAETQQNLEICDRRVSKDDRKSVQIPSETKLYISDKKPMIPLRCTSMEFPLSSQFTQKIQPLSIRGDSHFYNESLCERNSALQKQLESRPVAQMRTGSLSITIRPNRLTVMDYFKEIDDVWDSSGRKEEPKMKETADLSCDNESLEEIADNTATDAEALEINDGIDSGSSADLSNESEELDEFTKTVIKADISGRALHSSSKTEFPSKPQYNALKQSKFLRTDTSSLLADVHSRFAGKVYHNTNTESRDQTTRDFKEQTNFEDDTPLNSGPSFLVSQGQLQESRFRRGLSPGKLADSPDRNLQMKFPRNDGLVDSAFGSNSEYVKCKHEEDSPETDFRSSAQQKCSEMYLSPSEYVSKINSPELQSIIKNRSDSHIFRSDASVTPNGSTAQRAPVPGERYTDGRRHMKTVSLRSLSRAFEAPSDVINDLLEPESVQRIGNKVKATDGESIEEDRFLMTLMQQHHTPDLPELESFCTPQLQPRNLVRTSHFTTRSGYGEDSELLPLRSCTDEFDEEIALKSRVKSPKSFNIGHLKEEEPSGIDCNQLACSHNESHKKTGEEHSEVNDQQKLQATEYPGKMLKHIPDPRSSVLEEGAAALAAIPRCQGRESYSMTLEDVNSKPQGSDCCSERSKNYADASFIGNDTKKSSEAMSCQEFMDFPDNLVIEPPESFSDFTIVL